MLRNDKVEAQVELKDILETWYVRWNHLNEWMSNGRDNQLASKKDYYRRFAYSLVQRNNTLLLDADNFAKMAKEKPAEHDEKPAKNEVRFLAAPAMLRSALEACFTEEKGKRVLWTSLASSKTCSKCWKPNEGLGSSRTFTCKDCGHTEDRESNATANVLGEFLRKPGSFSADKKVAERLATKIAEEETAQMAAA
jgi:transposase